MSIFCELSQVYNAKLSQIKRIVDNGWFGQTHVCWVWATADACSISGWGNPFASFWMLNFYVTRLKFETENNYQGNSDAGQNFWNGGLKHTIWGKISQFFNKNVSQSTNIKKITCHEPTVSRIIIANTCMNTLKRCFQLIC